MEIRIPKDKFQSVKEFIRIAQEHDSAGIILQSGVHFERYSKQKKKAK